MPHDLRELSRLAKVRKARPTAAIMDGRTLQSSPKNRALPGYDGYKRRKGQQGAHRSDLLAVSVTVASEQERNQVGVQSAQIQQATGDNLDLAYVDQDYTGEESTQDVQAQGIRWEVVKLSEAKKGFVLLPRRWVVERSFGWAARIKRLSRDYERFSSPLVGMHWLTFITLMSSSLFGKS